jgi:hypothetical protein
MKALGRFFPRAFSYCIVGQLPGDHGFLRLTATSTSPVVSTTTTSLIPAFAADSAYSLSGTCWREYPRARALQKMPAGVWFLEKVLKKFVRLKKVCIFAVPFAKKGSSLTILRDYNEVNYI